MASLQNVIDGLSDSLPVADRAGQLGLAAGRDPIHDWHAARDGFFAGHEQALRLQPMQNRIDAALAERQLFAAATRIACTSS